LGLAKAREGQQRGGEVAGEIAGGSGSSNARNYGHGRPVEEF
jgi:hypothetical protein